METRLQALEEKVTRLSERVDQLEQRLAATSLSVVPPRLAGGRTSSPGRRARRRDDGRLGDAPGPQLRRARRRLPHPCSHRRPDAAQRRRRRPGSRLRGRVGLLLSPGGGERRSGERRVPRGHRRTHRLPVDPGDDDTAERDVQLGCGADARRFHRPAPDRLLAGPTRLAGLDRRPVLPDHHRHPAEGDPGQSRIHRGPPRPGGRDLLAGGPSGLGQPSGGFPPWFSIWSFFARWSPPPRRSSSTRSRSPACHWPTCFAGRQRLHDPWASSRPSRRWPGWSSGWPERSERPARAPRPGRSSPLPCSRCSSRPGSFPGEATATWTSSSTRLVSLGLLSFAVALPAPAICAACSGPRSRCSPRSSAAGGTPTRSGRSRRSSPWARRSPRG